METVAKEVEFNPKKYTKILVIDVEPSNDNINKDLLTGRLAQILKYTSLYQNVVIVSDLNINSLHRVLNPLNIKKGFLVGDAGARIWDIESKKLIYEKKIASDNVRAIIHYGIMSSLLLMVSLSESDLAYSMDLINASTFKKNHYFETEITNEYSKFIEQLDIEKVYSVFYYAKDRNFIKEKYPLIEELLRGIGLDTSLNYQLGKINITDSEVSKYNAILRIMDEVKINNFNNVHYFAINSISQRCLKSFSKSMIYSYNWLYYNKKDIFNRIASFDRVLSEIVNIITWTNNGQRLSFESDDKKVKYRSKTIDIKKIKI